MDWHHRRLNETLGEHDMRMESSPRRNIHAVLHRENERDDSAMLPTSLSSSNSGREITVGTEHTMRGGNVVGTTAPTVGGRIVGAPPQNSWIEGSAASASNVADGRVVVENIPGVAVAGMLAVMGGVDVERVVTTTYRRKRRSAPFSQCPQTRAPLDFVGGGSGELFLRQ